MHSVNLVYVTWGKYSFLVGDSCGSHSFKTITFVSGNKIILSYSWDPNGTLIFSASHLNPNYLLYIYRCADNMLIVRNV